MALRVEGLELHLLSSRFNAFRVVEGFRVQGSGFRVWGLGFRVWGLGFGVWVLGFGVWGLGLRVKGLGGFRSANSQTTDRDSLQRLRPCSDWQRLDFPISGHRALATPSNPKP